MIKRHDLNREGRKLVEAELHKRGVTQVTTMKDGKRSYLLASNTDRTRTIELRVKTKQSKGNWHATTDDANPCKKPPKPEEVSTYWVFINFEATPRCWIVPDWWIRDDIHRAHQEYLERGGGHRSKNDLSNHHSIDESRLQRWQDKWEILHIFPLPSDQPISITSEVLDVKAAGRVSTTTERIIRDSEMARRVKGLHRFECQICGHTIQLPDGSRYAEAHHVQPLGQPHNGPDTIGNILCVCPNHHAELDYGVTAISLSELRLSPNHTIDERYVEYHNRQILKHI